MTPRCYIHTLYWQAVVTRSFWAPQAPEARGDKILRFQSQEPWQDMEWYWEGWVVLHSEWSTKMTRKFRPKVRRPILRPGFRPVKKFVAAISLWGMSGVTVWSCFDKGVGCRICVTVRLPAVRRDTVLASNANTPLSVNPPLSLRADFWEGDEDSNFSIFRVRWFSEWPEPLHWIAFPVEILTKPLIHWIASPLFTENPFFSLKSSSSHPLPKNRLWKSARYVHYVSAAQAKKSRIVQQFWTACPWICNFYWLFQMYNQHLWYFQACTCTVMLEFP